MQMRGKKKDMWLLLTSQRVFRADLKAAWRRSQSAAKIKLGFQISVHIYTRQMRDLL